MKKWISILLLLAYMFANIKDGIIWVNYAIHKDHIASNFCKQKEFKYSMCKGVCHVLEIIEFHPNETGESYSPPKVPDLLLSFFPKELLILPTIDTNSLSCLFFYREIHQREFISQTFKPPEIS